MSKDAQKYYDENYRRPIRHHIGRSSRNYDPYFDSMWRCVWHYIKPRVEVGSVFKHSECLKNVKTWFQFKNAWHEWEPEVKNLYEQIRKMSTEYDYKY